MKWALALLVALFAVSFARDALSQTTYPNCNGPVDGTTCDDEGTALAAAKARMDARVAALGPNPAIVWCQNGEHSVGSVRNRFTFKVAWASGGCETSLIIVYREYPKAKTCSTRTGDGDGPPANSIFSGSGSSICYNGCQYSTNNTSQISFSGQPSLAWVGTNGPMPTGAVCALPLPPPPSQQDECRTQDTLTQCLKPDGRTCTKSGSGKLFCWQPGESGTKVSGNEAATKAPQGVDLKAPPVPPTNNGDWVPKGSGTQSINTGGVTNNYNTQNYESNYGPSGDGCGATKPDGSEEGGEEEGETAGAGLGELAGAGDETLPGVMSQHFSQIQAAPIYQGVTNFFSVQGGGTCPVFVFPESEYTPVITIDLHCSGGILSLLQAAGYLVFAFACYVAARIAFA